MWAQVSGATIQHDEDGAGSGFDTIAFHRSLETETFCRHLLTSARMPSTQTFMQDNRLALPSGATRAGLSSPLTPCCMSCWAVHRLHPNRSTGKHSVKCSQRFR